MSGLVKLVGSGVGLAKEYHAYRKAAKSAQTKDAEISEDDFQYGSGRHESVDNVIAETLVHAPVYQAQSAQKSNGSGTPSLEQFTVPPPSCDLRGPLALPVILPQRRPGSNSRGFVRAYAPMLHSCGIDQTLWFDFLNGFHEALKKTPLFHVANAAIAIGSIPIPSLTVQVSAIALGAALDISSKQFMKYQTNKYLDNMNEQIFKPRGLYTAIMSFEPDSMQSGEVVDVNTNVVKSFGSRIGNHYSERLRTSSGTTHGEFELPAAAPLVFPDLSELPEHQRTNRMNKSGFFDDYLDRRAQAKFSNQNPDSKLAVPRPKFASSWSDPTAGVFQATSLREMVGGGNTSGRQRGDQQRLQAEYRTASEQTESSSGAKKLLQKNILYLTVVNMPSEEEVNMAQGLLRESGSLEHGR
ncbi:hypothetical protein H2200_008075 [Cladophialophora chaetospira]|uniref:Uncharacterized protein n=1 Tax=Cladophialophora chaetospira TaxID=386627 RepID=A0AA38X7E0_9EURO|nr:hypothetical protein H2200_008075 [Cladophialophora chaetospira]